MRRRSLLLLIAGILWVPAIGARAQETTTTTAETTTTTAAETTTTTEETTTTTTAETTTTTEETTTTTEDEGSSFGPEAGALSISAPASSELSTGTPTNAGDLSAQLGAVTVEDTRGAVNASWTATVTSTHFTTGAASANETIDRGNVAYRSGPATDVAGVGVFTPGQLVESQSLDVPRTAFTMASGAGDNTATWNPTIIVTIPSSAVVGTYAGTITHSAA